MAIFIPATGYDVADHTYATDQLKVALGSVAPSSPYDLGDVTQIAYTNLSSRDITTTSWTAGTNTLILEDLVLSASGGSVAAFRYVYIYNDTKAGDPLVGYFDLGREFELEDREALTLNFDSSGGLFNGTTSLIPNQTVSRSLSSLIKTTLEGENIELFWLVELEFDSPNQVYLWSGIGSLTLDGITYTGAGDLMQISELRESSDIAAYGATITLSGIPSEFISLALEEPYQGRKAIVKFGVISGSTYTTAVVYTGEMDQMNISYGPETVNIALDVESRLVDLQRARIRRYSHADQQSRYSGDLAFEFVTRLQNESLEWA